MVCVARRFSKSRFCSHGHKHLQVRAVVLHTARRLVRSGLEGTAHEASPTNYGLEFQRSLKYPEINKNFSKLLSKASLLLKKVITKVC